MAKAGGNMHSPADDSTPKFGGVPPHPPADQHHGMVNQNEQHGEPSHGSPPEPRPAEPHTPARANVEVERFWAIFGYLLILLAFILDLVFWCCCVLVLLGFYFGLGHFSVVGFWSC